MADIAYKSVWVAGQQVNKTTLTNYLRDQVVHRFTNVAALQATSTYGTFSVFVAGALYEYDAADTTTAHNGTTVLVSADGNRYKRKTLTVQALDDIVDVVITSPTNGQVLKYSSGTSTWINDTDSGGSGGRTLLTANTTYYVRTDGNDANSGTADTSGGAWLTLQKAYNVIAGTLDLGGFTVTVQVRDGTYTGNLSVSQPWTGGGAVTFQGNSSTPANCLISTSGACVDVTCALPGTLLIKDMKLTSSASSCLFHRGTGRLQHGNNDYGSASAYHLRASNPGATIISVSSSYSVTGSAISHWYAEGLAKVETSGGTVTFSGTPAFSVATAQALRGGFIFMDTVTMSGSATGTRYSAISNSVIDTRGSGATHIPGNSSGTTATGGQYI